MKLIKTYLSTPARKQDLWDVLMVAVFMIAVSVVSWGNIEFKSLMSANWNTAIFDHQYWRLFSTLFVHEDLQHLLGNLLFFIPFAWFVRNYFGLTMFPLVTFASGVIINYFVLLYYPSEVGVIGASGMVYFLVAFWMIQYIGIQKDLSFRSRLIRVFGLLLAEFAPHTYDPHTSYLSHAIGFALGIFIGIFYFYAQRAHYRASEVWQITEPAETLEYI